jgi:hypothetical protein
MTKTAAQGYRLYINALHARLTPKGISSAPLEKSQRYPGAYEGTTIITPPWEPAHATVYQFLADSQPLVSSGNAGLIQTPRSSFHLTELGITHGDLQARLRQNGALSNVLAETNRVLRAYNPKSFTPNFRVAGFIPVKDSIAAGLEPLDEKSFLAMTDLRELLLNDPALNAAGVEGGKQPLFHITTHYQVREELNRPALEANLTGLNWIVAKRAPLVFPVTQLIFTRFYTLGNFFRISRSPIVNFS